MLVASSILAGGAQPPLVATMTTAAVFVRSAAQARDIRRDGCLTPVTPAVTERRLRTLRKRALEQKYRRADPASQAT